MVQALASHGADAVASRRGNRGGRNTFPECYRDIALWPTFDSSLLQSAQRRRFDRLVHATKLYLAHLPMREVLSVAEVSERRFLRIFSRILQRDGSGQILGFRAFVKGAYRAAPVRKLPLAPSSSATAGFFGAFRLLLSSHPEIAERLTAYLNGYGLSGLRPSRAMFHTIHKKFVAICEELGLGEDRYPLNTRERARRALRLWIDTDYLPNYTRRFTALEYGQDAAGLLSYGQGDGRAERRYFGYGAWIIDAAVVDVFARCEIPNMNGDWEDVELRKFQVLRAVHKESSANLAHRLVLAAQVSAQDLAILTWDAMNGPPSVPKVIAGAMAEAGAGYPACLIARLRFAVPSVIYLDNALAHLADDFQYIMTVLCGAKVILGTPATPHERAAVESKFAVIARRLLHQLPSTAGTGPKDPMRSAHAVPLQMRLRASELEQVIDAYVMNENILPAAGAHNIAPLVRLQRQLDAGAIEPQYLAPDKRHAYFFCRPTPVTVHVNLPQGRRPYINYMYQRYSSASLGKHPELRGKKMWVRADFRNLRTVMLFTQEGHEFGLLTALGHWGDFPHDVRIRKLYGRLKREGAFGPRADDRPLQVLFAHLRAKAPRDANAALQMTYLMDYLQRSDFVVAQRMQQDYQDWKAASTLARAVDPEAIRPVRLDKPLPEETSPLPAPAHTARGLTTRPSTGEHRRWSVPRRALRG